MTVKIEVAEILLIAVMTTIWVFTSPFNFATANASEVEMVEINPNRHRLLTKKKLEFVRPRVPASAGSKSKNSKIESDYLEDISGEREGFDRPDYEKEKVKIQKEH